MKSLKVLSLIILSALLLQGCMMSFLEGGIHGVSGGSKGTIAKNPGDFNLKLSAIKDNYFQSLKLLLSKANGNSKYYISTENLKSGNMIEYNAEMNLYRVPFKGAVLDKILKNVIAEKIPFTPLKNGEQYINYSLPKFGQYYLVVNIYSIKGEKLNSPLSFNYRFDYRKVSEETDNNFLGINYWILGAAMVGMMTIVMIIGI
jgi:hypothetical protein